YSFAAGARASAAQTGTFVWSDGSDGDAILASSRAYQFLARASGGVTFWTNAASTVGATLAPGSGTWASASDRNLKTDVARIDDAAVLDKVATLPIERWSYKSERGVHHVGPMAQDFYAAFGVGEDDKHITSIDEDGVALAAIKALHRDNRALHAENARLRAASLAQSTTIATMQAQLARLSAQIAGLRAR
ncbi:MAG TPA: tail fiber domain-containing protein, partial [Candidatus Elarobacter sp.]|nr:tail fiber domain-containing protein [Candidatus Elarobacter sp.]